VRPVVLRMVYQGLGCGCAALAADALSHQLLQFIQVGFVSRANTAPPRPRTAVRILHPVEMTATVWSHLLKILSTAAAPDRTLGAKGSTDAWCDRGLTSISVRDSIVEDSRDTRQFSFLRPLAPNAACGHSPNRASTKSGSADSDDRNECGVRSAKSKLHLSRSFLIPHSAFRISQSDSFAIEAVVSQTCAHRPRLLPSNIVTF